MLDLTFAMASAKSDVTKDDLKDAVDAMGTDEKTKVMQIRKRKSIAKGKWTRTVNVLEAELAKATPYDTK